MGSRSPVVTLLGITFNRDARGKTTQHNERKLIFLKELR